MCYPGGSKTRVNKAAKNIRNGSFSKDDEAVIDLTSIFYTILRIIFNYPNYE